MNLAIVDLECTDLQSDKGFLLCAGIKPLGKKGKIWTFRDAGFGSSRREVDKKLVQVVKREMELFDGWITWNGLLFDLPFLDDRLTICGHGRLEGRFAHGLDMMWHAAKGKAAFTSRRLDNVSRALGSPEEKTALDLGQWKEAEAEVLARGKAGMRYYDKIVHHCLKDLEVTEWVYGKLKNRVVSISKRR